MPDIEQAVSFLEKPEPDTATINPAEPELGLREMDGTVIVLSVELLLI